MDEQVINENKQRVQKSNFLLVCGMLSLYAICILGSFGTILGALQYEKQAYAVHVTSTAFAIATQQSNATSTASVRATELAQYELVDPFDSNINNWRAGVEDSEYWQGSTQVTNGFYIWDVREVKKDFVSWADFPGNPYFKNYDTYVDLKFEEVPTGKVCAGLIFRKAALGWDTGGYTFMICNPWSFRVHYRNYKDGWQTISGDQFHPGIQTSDWNRLEVSVNGSHFIFRVNNQVVYEVDDERQPSGGVALIIDIDEAEAGTKILFDNFGYQSR